MVKSGKSFVKIESRLQIALFFLIYRNFQPLSPPAYPPPVYLILPNVPVSPFIWYPRAQEYTILFCCAKRY